MVDYFRFRGRSILKLVIAVILLKLIFESTDISLRNVSQSLQSINEGFKYNTSRQLTIGLIFPSEDGSKPEWTKEIPETYRLYPYNWGSPKEEINYVPINKGKEAMTYLTFLIQYYDDLPDKMFFFHGHNQSWHQPLGLKPLLAKVTWERVEEYLNILGCDLMRDDGLIAAFTPGEFKNTRFYSVPLIKMVLLGTSMPLPFLDSGLPYFAAMWRELNMKQYGYQDINDRVPLQDFGCSQFLVGKKTVLKWPKEAYVALRNWVMYNPADSQRTGWVFEHSWHAVFTGKGGETVEDQFRKCRIVFRDLPPKNSN